MKGLDKNLIQRALQNPLPGKVAHLTMAPPWRRNELEPKAHYRPSAVLIMLYPDSGNLFFPLIHRSGHLNHHANQIGLPGGALELDETAEHAALRETEEELGISQNEICVMGRLSSLGLSSSGYTIQPVVGFCEQVPSFEPNPQEVDSWFAAPLTDLLYKNHIIDYRLEDGRHTPAYLLLGKPVWGATAMILAEFAALLEQVKL
ncbi:MAG: CoA pyrophosphatase [Treponema sp.]|nr:CoA pyrophosphatase [Treponema sp.]